MSLLFKTNRERSEYAALATENPRLFDLVHDLVEYVFTMLHKDVVLTSVHRTPEEQAALYAQAGHKVLVSKHFSWEAVDLRSSIYTADEIVGITNYLRSQYKDVFVLYHELEGNTYHFHLALSKPAASP